MIGANQYELTWSHFDGLHKDRKMAFENLCRSLFKNELCMDGVILHSDHNHPGVEVAPVLSKDGHTKISFQAKHFDNLIGYEQIKKSAQVAAGKYCGKLDVIYLYCNKDITETREPYKEIVKLLGDAGIRVELITGQTILDQAMNYPPVLSCYFGLDSLDDKWFQKNIDLSLENLGRRYNSLFNVDTEAQRNISLFLRENAGVVEVNSKKNDFISELKELRWRCDRKYKAEVNSLSKWAEDLEPININTFSDALNWKRWLENDCNDIFTKLESRLTSINKELQKCSYENPEYKNLRNEEFEIERILSVSSCISFSSIESTMLNSKVAIITGDMGTGKTQLMATAAKRMMENGRPTLLLLGQTFISDDSIEKQIIQNLEGLSSGQNFESIVATMDNMAELIGEDAIIFIDAINESKNRAVWKIGINRVMTTLEQYSHVKLVISLRTGFEELTLSQSMLDKKDAGDIALIRHTGFADDSPERIYEFLSYCGIPFSPEYYLHSEMTNPLFLTWFCNTYCGDEQGLLTLIDNVLEQADREGSIGAGMSESVGILKPLIYEMFDVSKNGTLTKQELLGLSAWNTYGVINKIGYINAIERAGVLTSFVREKEENYYVGYNLLEDYLKATKILNSEQSKEKIIDYCEKNLFELDSDGNINKYGNESVFAMIASLYAMKYGDELIEVLDSIKDNWDKERLLEEYYSSFIWRSSYITYDRFLELINKYPVDSGKVWDVFIENSVKEKSQINALGLTRLLNRYSLSKRDYLWTIVINDYNEYNRIINLAYYIEAGNGLEGLSENKAYLLTITFTWMLSSSNRNLRDRVSKAMIEILKEHFSICERLLELFKDVNDPYIIQRLYGVVFGAVMRRTKKQKDVFKDLAQWIYTQVFNKEMVYPDILLRDYARLIVERFYIEYPDDLDLIELERIKAPYISEPIPIVEKVDYGTKDYQDGELWPLLFSMKFDMDVKGIGMYGDFGRYIFQSALNEFIDLDVENVYYYAMQFILNDLGYNLEYFAEYDKNRSNYDRHSVKKVERIGKKYQWIAMYNILARVSDTYKLKNWDWNDKCGVVYDGPWDPFVRDFDPTLNAKIRNINKIPEIELPVYGQEGFCGVDATDDEINKWIVEEDEMFQDFNKRLIHKDQSENEWVSLYLYQENKYSPKGEEDSFLGYPKGEQHIWTIATMYISTEVREKYTEQELIDSDFIMQNTNGMRECSSLFAREYAWSPGYEATFKEYKYDNDETKIKAFPAAIDFSWGRQYDASQEEITSFAIPAGEIIKEMQLYLKETDGVYYYDEEIAAFDLAILGNGHSAIVIRRDILDGYIEKTGTQVFWTVVGEKQYFQGDMNQKWQRREGYFVYEKDKITGTIRIVNND